MLSNSHNVQAWSRIWSLLGYLTIVYCAVVMAELAGVPWLGKAGLLLLGAAAIAGELWSHTGFNLPIGILTITGLTGVAPEKLA